MVAVISHQWPVRLRNVGCNKGQKQALGSKDGIYETESWSRRKNIFIWEELMTADFDCCTTHRMEQDVVSKYNL
jgi:hypothetical protein